MTSVHYTNDQQGGLQLQPDAHLLYHIFLLCLGKHASLADHGHSCSFVSALPSTTLKVVRLQSHISNFCKQIEMTVAGS